MTTVEGIRKEKARINELNRILDSFAMDAFHMRIKRLDVNEDYEFKGRMASVITEYNALLAQQLDLVTQYLLYVQNPDNATIRKRTKDLYETANPQNMISRLKKLEKEFEQALDDLSRAPTERSEPSGDE